MDTLTPLMSCSLKRKKSKRDWRKKQDLLNRRLMRREKRRFRLKSIGRFSWKTRPRLKYKLWRDKRLNS
jgi:hypothetical protein